MRNRFFNQYGTTSEQNVLEDLIIESMKIYGINVYYLPRTHVNLDMLFKEDASMKFDDAIEIEMYLKTYDGYMGQNDFISKFGLQIDESLTFTVSQKRFRQTLQPKLMTEYSYNLKLEDNNLLRQELNYDQDYTGYIRPKEGDLVWFSLTKDLFEIKFVEDIETLFQLGKLYTYELRCDKYEYTSNILDTGESEIDNLETEFSQATSNAPKTLLEDSNILLAEDGGYLMEESNMIEEKDNTAQNDYLTGRIHDDDILDFSEKNPFTETRVW
jgi:hypothetical protein